MYMTPTVTGCSNGMPVRPSCSVRLSRLGQVGALQQLEDFLFARAVEHGRRHVHSGERLGRELVDIGLGQLVDKLVAFLLGIDFLEPLLQLRGADAVAQVFFDFMPELARGPSEMSLENLADVHARRHAERIQHDIDRGAVGQRRHVFLGQNPREHALVAVASRHLVADLEAALDGDEHLDHLDHARRELVTRLQAFELGAVMTLHRLDVRVHRGDRRLGFFLRRFVLDADLAP